MYSLSMVKPPGTGFHVVESIHDFIVDCGLACLAWTSLGGTQAPRSKPDQHYHVVARTATDRKGYHTKDTVQSVRALSLAFFYGGIAMA
jgi:hypothetical protein